MKNLCANLLLKISIQLKRELPNFNKINLTGLSVEQRWAKWHLLPLTLSTWGGGHGVQGQICHILTPASFEPLPAPSGHTDSHTYIHLGGGGSDIRSMSSIRLICKCRCPPLQSRMEDGRGQTSLVPLLLVADGARQRGCGHNRVRGFTVPATDKKIRL